MIRVRTLGLAFVAVFAISAVASATASATLPEFSASTTFTSAGGAGKLKTAKSEVSCTSNTTEEGKVTAPKSASVKAVVFKGCKSSGAECKNAGKEEIKTVPLSGTLGYVEKAAVPPKVGVELKPTTGTVFAEFTCGGIIKVTVSGATVGQLTPVNTLTEKFELAWRENAGKNGQEWTKLEGGLEATLKAFGETAWLVQTDQLTTAAKVEVKA
jgi:hypothetical protein